MYKDKEFFTFNKDLEELARKIVVIDKFTDHNPGDKYSEEETELIDKETEHRRQDWFAKLRGARAKKTDAHGSKTYQDVHEFTTQEEYDYYLDKALAVPPEQRYQDRKRQWYFHESNWSMRGLNADDGYGCSPHRGCIPQCRYFAETGRVEDSEIIERFEEYYKNKILSYHVDNKGQIIYHYPTNE